MNAVVEALEAHAVGGSASRTTVSDVAAARDAPVAPATLACLIVAPPVAPSAQTSTTLQYLEEIAIASCRGVELHSAALSVRALRARLQAPPALVCMVSTPALAQSAVAITRVA